MSWSAVQAAKALYQIIGLIIPSVRGLQIAEK